MICITYRLGNIVSGWLEGRDDSNNKTGDALKLAQNATNAIPIRKPT